jgi:hypothetical protein
MKTENKGAYHEYQLRMNSQNSFEKGSSEMAIRTLQDCYGRGEAKDRLFEA